ncbi:MAG TPA: hypothetical protein DEO33_04465 [Rikenellaceae bacterium]|nr:hypothetical protein [Rikenellaceae bacterium]
MISFLVHWMEIEWEFVETNDIDFYGSKDHIIIHNVSGFTSPGYLRKHFLMLFWADYSTFKISIEKEDKESKVRLLESIIGQLEDYESFFLRDETYDGKVYKIFKKGLPMETNKNPERQSCLVPDSVIFKDSEAFAKALGKAIEEIKGYLFGDQKSIIESNVPDQKDFLTFEYIGYNNADQEYLTDLFLKLCDAKFLKSEANSIIDFKRIFSGKNLRRQIVWNADNQDLSCFVKCLKKYKLLKRPGECWKKACHCFVNKQNLPFGISELSKTQVTPRQKEISEIVFDSMHVADHRLKLGNSK